MTVFLNKTTVVVAATLALAAGLASGPGVAQARVHHRTHKSVRSVPPAQSPQRAAPRQQGVVGYFGPGAYGPGYGPLGPITPAYGYGYGYGYGPPRGDLGLALLGALNGGGFRGFVECGNYYARTPGACGF